MKRMIRTGSNKVVAQTTVKNRGYIAAEKFKKKYPKAYEVLGR